jgi:DMSO/TMAO reductase YedYZ heme-binding membrane subunit
VTTWIVLRAAGIGAYVMLFLSVAWGLAATTSVLGKRVSKATATTVHQFIATCGLVLLGVHLGGLLIDAFMPFSISDLVIPMASSFRPVATTFGVVAMYATVFVVVTSWLRRPIGTKWWRRTHLLAVPTFALSMIHGVFSGTDTVRPLMWWTYVATGLIVVFLLIVRGLTAGYRPPRAARAPEAVPGRDTPASRTAARPAPRPRPAPDLPPPPPPLPDPQPAAA